jgi:hypothetical protein
MAAPRSRRARDLNSPPLPRPLMVFLSSGRREESFASPRLCAATLRFLWLFRGGEKRPCPLDYCRRMRARQRPLRPANGRVWVKKEGVVRPPVRGTEGNGRKRGGGRRFGKGGRRWCDEGESRGECHLSTPLSAHFSYPHPLTDFGQAASRCPARVGAAAAAQRIKRRSRARAPRTVVFSADTRIRTHTTNTSHADSFREADRRQRRDAEARTQHTHTPPSSPPPLPPAHRHAAAGPPGAHRAHTQPSHQP